jgi:hypothetical protein
MGLQAAVHLGHMPWAQTKEEEEAEGGGGGGGGQLCGVTNSS